MASFSIQKLSETCTVDLSSFLLPEDVQSVEQSDVAHFFGCEIRGIFRDDGKLKNTDNLREIGTFDTWVLCRLNMKALEQLSLPDGRRMLLKDKDVSSLPHGGFWAARIAADGTIPPLILKLPAGADASGASFGILDGSHRAQVYYKHILDNPTETRFQLEAYIGFK